MASSGTWTVFFFYIILLLVTLVLSSVVAYNISQIPASNLSSLQNISISIAVSSFVLLLLCIPAGIYILPKYIPDQGTSTIVIGILFGFISLILAVLMSYVAWSLFNNGSFVITNPNSKIAYNSAVACSTILFLATILIIFGLLIFNVYQICDCGRPLPY